MPLLIIALIIFGISFWLYWTDREQSREPIDEELLKAAKGNRRRVQERIGVAKAQHPDKSERWYQEKVLHDLQTETKYAIRPTTHRERLSFREIIESLLIFSLVASLIDMVARRLGHLLRR